MKRYCVFFFFCICGVFGVSQEGMAAGNIHIGTLEIHPIEAVSQTYNDNIYLEPNNQENGDQVTVSKFGVLLNKPVVPGKEYLFTADYFADVFQYNQNSRENRTDHTVNASAQFVFPGRLLMRVREHYKKTADPPNSELTNLEKRVRNNNEGVLGYKGELFGIEVGSQYIRDNYDTLNNLDKKETITIQTLYYNVSPKTALFVEYNAGKIRYDEQTTNVHSEYTQWRGGIKGTLAPKITGVIKGGYKSTEYEDTRTINEKDFAGGTAFVNITYALQKRTALSVFGEKGSVESTYLSNNYYVNSKIGGKLEHQLMHRLFFTGEGFYQIGAYPEKLTDGGKTGKRRDHTRTGTGGLRYELFDWLHLHAEYRFKEKDSNFDPYDYTNNIYAVKISAQF